MWKCNSNCNEMKDYYNSNCNAFQGDCFGFLAFCYNLIVSFLEDCLKNISLFCYNVAIFIALLQTSLQFKLYLHKYPRIGTILGRTDDMVKVKGVNIFPSQIDELLKGIDGASSEYQVMIDHMNGKDLVTLFVEKEPGADAEQLATSIAHLFKTQIGILVIVKPVGLGDLPRSEKKSTRIYDNRY